MLSTCIRVNGSATIGIHFFAFGASAIVIGILSCANDDLRRFHSPSDRSSLLNRTVIFIYGAKKVSILRAVKMTEDGRRGERKREKGDVGRNCRYRRNGDGIIFTLLKRAMTVDDSERTRICIHAPGILPIQLPVSGYLPTGHFRYIPAGGDRHGKWYRSTYILERAERNLIHRKILLIHISAALAAFTLAHSPYRQETYWRGRTVFIFHRDHYFFFARRYRALRRRYVKLTMRGCEVLTLSLTKLNEWN